jgi:hypothetical protein
MADSKTVRQARWRKHKAGDHSTCRPERCAQAAPAARAELAARVGALGDGEVDPGRELARLAQRLITVSEQQPDNTAVAKALMAVLAAFPEPAQADPVAAQQAIVMGRRAAGRAGLHAVGDEERSIALGGSFRPPWRTEEEE